MSSDESDLPSEEESADEAHHHHSHAASALSKHKAGGSGLKREDEHAGERKEQHADAHIDKKMKANNA